MNHMPKALAAAPKEWFRFAAVAQAADGATSADVYIYDQIGENWWGGGVSAKKFAEQIDALDVDTIRLFLNSPGGAAWEGLTIMNALRRHRARVEVTVDGLAASAASVITMAGDHITMNRGSMLMIHDAWGFAIGNATDMEETAGILGKLSDSYADSYAARAGHDRAHWRELMKAETWFSAEEAVDAGLADTWDDADDAADAAARFDLSTFGFAYAGRAHAPAPPVAVIKTPDSTEPGGTNRKENVVANDDFKAGLIERLGMTDADASDEAVLAALDETLDEQADPNPAAQLPEGVVAIDATALAELRSQAAQGVQALAAQTKARRDGIIGDALASGRITPDSKDGFRALLDADEERTAKVLAAMVPNTVPVAEIGHAVGEVSADDALYAAAWGTDEKEA
ncbi:head maturation protease, ClpP-related [Microbacterium esteraromaticum]|uniref:head maturation protease, ClpP-related n=1 Tax=Microbacterium esteraromaticum TaxID=57043 RepID=UPI0019D3E971|nr:head maturation protease, ClpP-related [Microbacterium esteraromaticum]MBN7792422.1 ATP-dependent Clp protease proteolytic subunit [Microbacterium esteraromaticum]